jgi:hypothetical protein
MTSMTLKTSRVSRSEAISVFVEVILLIAVTGVAFTQRYGIRFWNDLFTLGWPTLVTTIGASGVLGFCMSFEWVRTNPLTRLLVFASHLGVAWLNSQTLSAALALVDDQWLLITLAVFQVVISHVIEACLRYYYFWRHTHTTRISHV